MNGGFLGYYKLMGQVAEALTLDTYPTTVPVFYLNKKIKTGFTGDICLVEEMTGNTTQAFQFNADGTFPTAALETFASSGDARLRRWYDANGSTRYIDFGTGTQQPLIVESGTATTLASQISPKFTGTEFGTLASSTGDYAFIHNGDVVGTTLVIAATASDERQQFIGTASGSARNGFGVTSFNNKRVLCSAIRTGGTAASLLLANDSFPSAIQVDLFTRWDAANATAADRIKVDVNGVESATNTITYTQEAASATNDLTMGAGATSPSHRRVVGNITGFFAWELDNYANRADILATL